MSAPDADAGEPEASGPWDGARLDVEAAFAEIVAHYDEDSPSAHRLPGPLGAPHPGSFDGPLAGPLPVPPPVRPATPHPPTEDAQERWEPPELPPFRRAAWRAWLPWAAVVASATFFLVVVLARLVLPGLALLGGVLVFAAGFVTLILRLPARRDDDDDGAVL